MYARLNPLWSIMRKVRSSIKATHIKLLRSVPCVVLTPLRHTPCHGRYSRIIVNAGHWGYIMVDFGLTLISISAHLRLLVKCFLLCLYHPTTFPFTCSVCIPFPPCTRLENISNLLVSASHTALFLNFIFCCLIPPLPPPPSPHVLSFPTKNNRRFTQI